MPLTFMHIARFSKYVLHSQRQFFLSYVILHFILSGISTAAFAPKFTVTPLIFYDVFLALQNWRRSKI